VIASGGIKHQKGIGKDFLGVRIDYDHGRDEKAGFK